MLAVREKAIEYINEIPEERLVSALDYLRFLCEPKHPLGVQSKEELYSRIDEGLDDIQNGKVQPFDEAMQEIRQDLVRYGV